MAEINFTKIRTLTGGQRESFETLCCDIVERMQMPHGSQFQRFRGDGGDGGVECLWTLPDGSELGYQVKYIFKLSKKQLTDSVKQAVNVHPRLTQYTFFFPYDFTGPTGRIGKSESEKFSGYIEEWKKLAATRNMNIDFRHFGEHELRKLLLSIDSDGSLTNYWFESSSSQTIVGNDNVQIGGDIIVQHINEKRIIQSVIQPGPQHISEKQAFEIKQLVDTLVELNSEATPNVSKRKLYSKWWGGLNDKFTVTSYKIIPVECFEEALTWLRQQKAIKVMPKLRRPHNDTWRNERYKAIWSRSKELGYEKHDVYGLAFQRLGKSISSLTELGEQDLDKLYKIIMKK